MRMMEMIEMDKISFKKNDERNIGLGFYQIIYCWRFGDYFRFHR
jgi:hypothetical protein